MKQGRASYSGPGDRHIQPISKPVDVAGVSQLGNHVGTERAVAPLYSGRGVQAPEGKMQSHKGGSQGRY